MATATSQARDVISRLFPVLWEDGHFLAIAKPPRVNLESPAWPHGPRVIDVVTGLLGGNRHGDANRLLPLILPERLSSGLALFARDEEARHRFAGMAAGNRLRFQHVAVVRGAPPRERIAIKPNPRARKGKSAPARPQSSARVEILDSHQNLHLARCTTPLADLSDVRRVFKAAGGLRIAGDIRPSPFAEARRTSPAKRPIVHLERLTFPHPFRKGEVEIVDPPPRALRGYLTSQVLLEEHLRAALAARLPLLVDDDTDAYRLITGSNEGIPGIVADRLADVVMLEALEERFRGDEQQLRQIANWYARVLGVKTVCARLAPRRRDDGDTRARGAELHAIKGTVADEFVVREKGVNYIIRPEAGWSVGLFLDQRENRRRIRDLATGKSVLNLFAYTCGFSVVAATGGATDTTSVDLSVANLEWGKANFAANALPLGDHTFIRSDAFEYFKRARRQDKSFDIIVLDPPTFARAKKPRRTFEIKKHLTELVAEAAELLRPGGHMLISTNYRQMTPAGLRARVTEALADRPHRIVAQPKLPVDFAADPDYQKALLVKVR